VVISRRTLGTATIREEGAHEFVSGRGRMPFLTPEKAAEVRERYGSKQSPDGSPLG
jgi:hypothetical protein